MKASVALVGDLNEQIIAHMAIPQAFKLVKKLFNIDLTWHWIHSTEIDKNNINLLRNFTGIWVVPGSPYQSMTGVLSAIRFAREENIPFLGTCGGFQHALIEYARNVCNIHNADHAESNPTAEVQIVTPLSCSLVEKSAEVFFKKNTQLYSIYNGQPTTESYRCNFGLNNNWKLTLETAGLCFSGYDISCEIRAFELSTHPFFIGTLFQPERLALENKLDPLILNFIQSEIYK